MNKSIINLFLSAFIFTTFSIKNEAQDGSLYKVTMLKKPVKIDAKWDKKEWKKTFEEKHEEDQVYSFINLERIKHH